MRTRTYTVTLEVEFDELGVSPEADEVVDALECSMISNKLTEILGVESLRVQEIS